MNQSWQPGDVVVRREILRGHPWVGYGVRVVEDSSDLLAVFLPSGSELGFGDSQSRWPHPWQKLGSRTWSGHGKLILTRPDDAYAVELTWRGPEREFEGWSIRLQDPIRRHRAGYDTLDHQLGYHVAPDGSWSEQDAALFEQRVAEERYTADQAEQIRATGAGVKSMLSWRNQWWESRWASWTPPAGWGATSLPAGWDAVDRNTRAAG